MLYDQKISLIIPCKNEEAALFSMLSKVPSFIDEIIVVDNGSTDNTPFIAQQFGAKVLREDRNIDGIGYGFAHQTGMKHATGDIIVAMDGDDTYPIEAIKNLITYMVKSNADFVSGARFPLSDSEAISPTRQLGVRILNLEVAFLYGYHTKDILSGMWTMKKHCIQKLILHNGEWNFSPEIKLAAINHPEIHFSEYHINHAVRLNGQSKQQIWRTGFSHLFYILKRRYTIDTSSAKQQKEYFDKQVRFAIHSLFSFFI